MKKVLAVLLFGGLVCALTLTGVAEEERTGAWVDEVVITREGSRGAAVSKLESGDIDIYGHDIKDPELFNKIEASSELDYQFVSGGSSEFLFNVYGPEFENGDLNPFHSARFREAMNWLVDRQYITDEILGGLGFPKWTQLSTQGPEHQDRYPDLVAEVEEHYSYDKEKAEERVTEEMQNMGAEMVDGTWHHEGEPVELICLIRTDLDPYPETGDYFADQLEDLGFETERLYRTSEEASPLWIETHPREGKWQVYTGGWGMPSIFRDESHNWNQFNTHRIMPYPAYTILEDELEDWSEFDEAASKLAYKDFNTMEERRELVETALWGARQFANNVWHTEPAGVVPHRDELEVVLDGAGGVSMQWPYTIHFQEDGEPVSGGSVHMELPNIMVDPWNPVDGSSFTYDMLVTRDSLGDGYAGLMSDPQNGLDWPLRVERAEVYVNEDLPVKATLDWVDLNKVEEIEVPDDAWSDWDAEKQEWITVGEDERFEGEEVTAKRKSVVYYPEDLYDFPLHDGSTISIGDFMLSMIFGFDRAKEESPIFDEAAVADFEGWHDMFKGVKIVSEDPLIIETYSDQWYLDAEDNVNTWFPIYGSYDWVGFWHNVSLGMKAEADSALAFSEDKADKLGVEWMDYTKGPSLDILEDYLEEAQEEGYVPYEPTLGDYITAEDARDRWDNLEDWYEDKGHFWVGCGPFYLEDVHAVEEIVELERFEDYPDPADRWLFMLEDNKEDN